MGRAGTKYRGAICHVDPDWKAAAPVAGQTRNRIQPNAVKSNRSVKSIGVLWAQYGPYHLARVAALKKLGATVTTVHAVELASQTSYYEWKRSSAVDLITLCPDEVVERLSFWKVFKRARRVFASLKMDVCILPSYAPK